MKKTQGLFLLIMAMCFMLPKISFLSVPEYDDIPETMMLAGTQYVKCQVVNYYPFVVEEMIVELSGEAVEMTGSRTYPWYGMTINGHLLFNANDKRLLYNPVWFGRTLRLKGYIGTAEIYVESIDSKKSWLKMVENGFFVTEVIGWVYITGYPVNSSNGTVAKEPVFFWIEFPAIKQM